MNTDYPSNSHKSKKKEIKEIQKVVSGEVKTKKQSELKKFASIFVPDDVDDVKTYILTEQILPTARDLIFDIIKTIIYGGDSRDYRRAGSSRTSYERYYDDRNARKTSYAKRNTYDYDDIVFRSRGDAEEVLETIDDLMERYHNVSIADLYEAAGLDCPHTYNRYGWDDNNNLRNAKIVRSGDGYMIKLPKARPLD